MNIEIIRMDNQGRGIGFYNNKIVFIPNTLPEELVEFTIEKETTKYIEGRLIKILKSSSKRVTPSCKYYGECGGCQLMHMSYDDQLLYKKDKLEQLFKRQLQLDLKIEVEASSQFNYRNKIYLHQGGFYDVYNKKIIKIDECLNAKQEINEVIDNNYSLIKYHDKLIVNKEDIAFETLNNIKYKISYDTFFQVNKEITLKMFDYIKENINSKINVLDLYSGSGSIGLYISDKVNKVLGIDNNKKSIEDANLNIELNNINNAIYICDDATNYLKQLEEYYDTVIVDPPRAGLTKEGISLIQDLKPNQIIYVSCEPMTLVRDLKELTDYEIKKTKAFDMFPNTYHIETIIILERKDV